MRHALECALQRDGQHGGAGASRSTVMSTASTQAEGKYEVCEPQEQKCSEKAQGCEQQSNFVQLAWEQQG